MQIEVRKPKVVLTDYMYESIEPFRKVFAENDIQFEAFQCKTREEIIEATCDADAVMTHFCQIDAKVIAKLTRCKIIARSAVGVDNIDIEAATCHRIPVVNVPDYGIEDVSNHAVMMILAVTKKLGILDKAVRNGVWNYALAKPVYRIQGKTLGLLGCGAIAQSVAKKMQAFQMEVIGYDPFLTQQAMAEIGIKKVEKEELFSASDVISIHLPLTKDTISSVNNSAFEKMKAGVFIVNTSRGGVIDEQALANALQQGIVSGVGLDVRIDEKCIDKDPLLNYENVILTPHSAWYSEESVVTLLTSAAQDVVRGLTGQPLRKPVNQIEFGREKEERHDYGY